MLVVCSSAILHATYHSTCFTSHENKPSLLLHPQSDYRCSSRLSCSEGPQSKYSPQSLTFVFICFLALAFYIHLYKTAGFNFFSLFHVVTFENPEDPLPTLVCLCLCLYILLFAWPLFLHYLVAQGRDLSVAEKKKKKIPYCFNYKSEQKTGQSGQPLHLCVCVCVCVSVFPRECLLKKII